MVPKNTNAELPDEKSPAVDAYRELFVYLVKKMAEIGTPEDPPDVPDSLIPWHRR